MAIEDAGIIQAKIELDISNLKRGAMEAQKAVKAIEVEAKKSNAETVNAFRNSTKATFDYKVELSNIALAYKTGSKTFQEAEAAKLAASQKHLDMLIDMRNRIAEVSGEESKEAAVYDKLIKKQVEFRDSMREIPEAGKAAGTGFFSGIKKGFDQTEKNAGKLGISISRMLTPALIGLSAGIKTIQAIGGAIKDAFMSNEKFRKGVENLKSALGEGFSAAVRPVSNFFTGIIENAAKSIRHTNDLKEALKRLKDETPDYGKELHEQLEKAQKDFNSVNEEINTLKERMTHPLNADYISFFEREIEKLLPQLDEAKKKLDEVQATTGNSTSDDQKAFKGIDDERIAAEKQLGLLKDEHAIDQAEYDQARLSALNNYINAVSKLVAENDLADTNISQGLKDQIAEYNKLEKQIEDNKNNEEANQKKITKAREDAIAKYEQAERRANDARAAGLIGEEEKQRQIAAAHAQEYSDLEAIVVAYKNIDAETLRQRNETAAIVKNNQDAAAIEKLRATILVSQADTLAQQAIEREREAGNIEEAIRLENELIEAQRKRERDALTSQDDFKKLSRKQQDEILAGYDAITAGMKKAYDDDAVNLLTQAEKTRSEALAQIQNQENALFISHEEAAERRLQAEQQYIQTLSGLRTEYKQLEGVEDSQAAHIAAIESAAIANAKALETTIKYQKEYAAETERLKAEYKNISAEMGNEATFAEIMAKEAERRAMQLERQRDAELAALETRYAAIAAEQESGELTEEETAHRDMLTAAINKNYDALKQLSNIQATSAAQQEIAGYAKDISDQYKDITQSLAEQAIMRDESLSDYEKEVALNNMARQAALDELDARFAALKAQREGGVLTEEEIALQEQLTAAINKNYDAIASGIKKADINFKDITTQIAQASVSAFTSITSAMSTIAQQEAQEAMEEVDRVLEEALKKTEEARNAALEEEGFIEAQRAENMQAQIDAAREANDEVLQYQMERRQREMEINEEYDAQAKEAEEAAKKEKAKLEYEAAKTAWEMDLAAAWASFPLTVMNAIESGWKAGSLIPVPGVAPALAATYAGLAGTAAGVQIAAIQKAEPKLKFADGGIVPGQPHANTDTIAAMVMPGELILNRAQQETLAPQLESKPLTVQINLDGRILSEAVINDYVNKGIVLIEARRGIR